MEDGEKSEEDEGYSPFGQDALKRYLKEIAPIPLLTAKEEKELTESFHRFKDAASKEKLIKANLRLVVKIALDYFRVNPWMNLLDLIEEGNLGLVESVKKFNPYKGNKFSTYASFWIKAHVKKHVMDDRSLVKISTTQGARKAFYQIGRKQRELTRIGISPTPENLAEAMDVSVQDVMRVITAGNVSLDELAFEEDGKARDILPSKTDVFEEAAKRIDGEILDEDMKSFKNQLTDRERFILEERILADEEDKQTLDELGARFNISRERARQVEARIIKKARICLQKHRSLK